MKKQIIFILLLMVLVITKSCKKDPILSQATDNSFNPEPFEMVNQPWYPAFNIQADNPLTKDGVMLGRMLFYDPIVSGDSTLSCGGCHQQSKGFSDPRRVSVGITGQLGGRNAPPIQNQMWNHLFFWDGRAKSLREQVLMPIQAHDEMNMNLYTLINKLENTPRYQEQFKKAFNVTNITPEHISKALEQFVTTLISFNSPIDKLYNSTDTTNVISASAARGLKLVLTLASNGGAECFHCHNGAFFGSVSATGSMSNNGLDAVITDQGYGNITGKSEDIGKFKIPSLRNVARTAPYMHDGRFQTLEEVIDFYSNGVKLNSPNLDPNNTASHGGQLNLSAQKKADIVEFLKALTDTTFLNNPQYKSPF